MPEKKSASIIAAAMVLTGTIVTATLKYQSDTKVTESTALTACHADLESSQSKYLNLLKEFESYARLALESISYRDQLENFIDGMTQYIVFIKVQDENSNIRMLMINQTYAQQVGVTKARYAGSSDREIFGDELGDIYEKRDRQVLKKRGSQLFRNSIVVNQETGKEMYFDVLKFVFKLHGESHYAIAGVGVPSRGGHCPAQEGN